MLYYYNIFLLLVQEISCCCCVLNNQSPQEKLFVSSVRWHFFVFRNSVEKRCVSWALPLIECVAVWALKLPVPHTDVLKPTSHKVFLRNYWNSKQLTANICHKPTIHPPQLVYSKSFPTLSKRMIFFSTPQSAGKSFEWNALYVRGYLICVLCISIPLRTYQRERRMTLKLFPADCEVLKNSPPK